MTNGVKKGILVRIAYVAVQDVQVNRPQVYALLRSVLNESHWDSAPAHFMRYRCWRSFCLRLMDLHSISVRAKRVPLGLSAVPPMTKWKYSLLQISLHSLSPHFALYSELELEHRSRSDCVHEQVAKRIANVRFTFYRIYIKINPKQLFSQREGKSFRQLIRQTRTWENEWYQSDTVF